MPVEHAVSNNFLLKAKKHVFPQWTKATILLLKWNVNDFSIRLQHNKMWRGLNTFWMHCISSWTRSCLTKYWANIPFFDMTWPKCLWCAPISSHIGSVCIVQSGVCNHNSLDYTQYHRSVKYLKYSTFFYLGSCSSWPSMKDSSMQVNVHTSLFTDLEQHVEIAEIIWQSFGRQLSRVTYTSGELWCTFKMYCALWLASWTLGD